MKIFTVVLSVAIPAGVLAQGPAAPPAPTPYAGGDPGGFDFKQLRSNTVVRWEYRPGSTVFFVWSQGRERSLDHGRQFDLTNDLRDMLRLHPDNTLLIKASYWFNP